MKNECIEISVIVPIYKVEKYIDRCLKSLINQTLKNIEIILVDDGSPDKCPSICDEYKKKYDNIVVIHQTNKGLSAARNAGIKIARGKYLCFIDSDDYVKEDMLEYLYANMKKFDSDIACCGFTAVYNNNLKERITIPNKDIVYDKESALKLVLFSGYIDVVAWNKLYKKELFNDIEYPEGKLYEDMLTTYKLIDKCEKISLHPDEKYFYCKRKDSIAERGFSKKTLDSLKACDTVVDFVINKYPNLIEVKIAQIHWYLVVINKMIMAKKIDNNLVKDTKEKIKKIKKEIIKTKYLNRIRKFQMLIFYYSLSMYKIMFSIYVKKYR